MKRIQTVETVEEAHLLISMLESFGIPCELTNDYIIAVDPLISNAVHGIDILVDEEHVVDAIGIIGALEEDKGDKHCPHCDSTRIRYLRLSWWNLIMFFGFIMILPIGRKRMYCQDCLKKFDETDTEVTGEEDELTKEALSHPFEDKDIKPLPAYLLPILVVAVLGVAFGIYDENFDRILPSGLFIVLVLLGGVGFFLYSVLEPSANGCKDEEKNDSDE